MKKLIIVVLVITLAAGAVFAQQAFRDGTYTGNGTGYYDGIDVAVVISGGRITAINITYHNETDVFMMMVNMPNTGLIPRMLAAQTSEVDIIVGATGTSNGLKEAVRNALNKAR